MFDLVDSSIRRGPNSIVFGKIFQLERFRSGFCSEIEEYRPSELRSIIFRSKSTELRKKVRRNLYERNFFDFRKKTFWSITLELLDKSWYHEIKN